MRIFPSLLCVCAIAINAAIAQDQQMPGPIAPPSPGTPLFELPATEDSCKGFYTDVALLLRWFKPVCASVPIVSIGNPTLTMNPGALGQPGTVIVVGGTPPHKFEFGMTPGFQLLLGWDRGDGRLGLEVSGFLLERAKAGQEFIANPDGTPASYLPYQAPDNSFQALPFTRPGLVTGSSVAFGLTHLWGIESDGIVPFTIDRGARTYYGKFLVGVRYLDLTDHVRVNNTLRLVADPSAFAFGAEDFTTHNQFAGPQVGTMLGVAWGPCSLEGTLKLAAGITEQTRTIQGGPLLSYSVLSPLLARPTPGGARQRRPRESPARHPGPGHRPQVKGGADLVVLTLDQLFAPLLEQGPLPRRPDEPARQRWPGPLSGACPRSAGPEAAVQPYRLFRPGLGFRDRLSVLRDSKGVGSGPS